MTVECEAAVLGCRGRPADALGALPSVLALPGADHVLDRLPEDRWVLLTADTVDATRALMAEAALPAPRHMLSCPTGREVTLYENAARAVSADPAVCLAFEDSADGVDTAREAGMQVVAVAGTSDPADLAAADFVIPSLLSVRVLGVHPFLVFEVDAIPDLGTGSGRRR